MWDGQTQRDKGHAEGFCKFWAEENPEHLKEIIMKYYGRFVVYIKQIY